MNFKKFKKVFEKREVQEFNHSVNKDVMISICVQTFNQKNYLEECLESILGQITSYSYEILLGEDGSTDGSRDLCMKYAKKYPDKIRLFLHNRKNNIKIDGKNTGLFNSFYNIFSANGKYIAYCDGDDYWTDSNKLQKQVDFLEKNKDFVISYHSIMKVDEKGRDLHLKSDQILKDFEAEDLKRVLVQPPISTWCFRNIISNIPIEMTQTLNADNFWISLLGFKGKGKYLEEINPSGYRIHTNGLWSLIDKNSQLNSKMKTYNLLSRYYESIDIVILSRYFKKRSNEFFKMIYYHHLVNMNLKFTFSNFFKFLKIKLVRN